MPSKIIWWTVIDIGLHFKKLILWGKPPIEIVIVKYIYEKKSFLLLVRYAVDLSHYFLVSG